MEAPLDAARWDESRRSLGVRAAVLMTRPEEDVEWVVEGLLRRRTLTLLAGPPKVGKSLLALNLAVAVAGGFGGEGVLGLRVRTGPAIVWALEDGPDRLRRRLRAMLGEVPASLPLFFHWGRLERRSAAGFSGGRARREGDLGLIVVDPLRELSKGDENNSAAMAGLLQPLREVAQEQGAAVLLVHHVRKGGAWRAGSDVDEAPGFEEIRGSGVLFSAVDGAILLSAAEPGEEGAPAVRLRVRLRDGGEVEALEAELDPLTLRFRRRAMAPRRPAAPARAGAGRALPGRTGRLLRGLAEARAHGGITSGVYQALVGGSPTTAWRDLRALAGHGLLRAVGEGRWTRYVPVEEGEGSGAVEG